MRDKVIAVVDVGWLTAAIVGSFAFHLAAFTAWLVLFVAVALGWRKALNAEPSTGSLRAKCH